MISYLLYIRHSVRGVKQLDTTENCLPYFNVEDKLSLYGHIISFNQGRSIKDQFKIKPSFILASNKERTIATAIAIGKGSKKNKIWFRDSDEDEDFFKDKPSVSTDSLIISNEKLNKYEKKIHKTRDILLKKFDYLKLPVKSNIVETGPDAGNLEGLIKDLNIFSQYPIFSQLSNIKTTLVEESDRIEKCKKFAIEVIYSTPSTFLENGFRMLKGIISLLFTQKLSVVIGHDDGINVLAKTLGKEFQIENHIKNFIPPNSGFLFILTDSNIIIELITVSNDEAKLKMYPYLEIEKPIHYDPYQFDIKKKYI
jgi:hypothetical protein